MELFKINVLFTKNQNKKQGVRIFLVMQTHREIRGWFRAFVLKVLEKLVDRFIIESC
jgi:hypothetical protein